MTTDARRLAAVSGIVSTLSEPMFPNDKVAQVQARATHALAQAQHTANLIAALNSPELQIRGVSRDDLNAQICERLGLQDRNQD